MSAKSRDRTVENSAFVIIDFQPAFTKSIQDEATFGQNVAEALIEVRRLFKPGHIIHVRANYKDTPMITSSQILNPGPLSPTDTLGTSWAMELDSEVVIEKHTVDGFYQTRFEDYLRGKGITHLYMCGMLTCCCVHQTAIGALLRGFIPTLIEDLCIDKSAQRQIQTFELYKDYMYSTCSMRKVLEDLRGGSSCG